MHELLLFVAQLGRRMEEIVISGRHGTAIHDSINQRGHRTALLHIQSRPIREIQGRSSFLRAEQIRRCKFRTPGSTAAVGMAIEAGVRKNFVDLRICGETVCRSRCSPLRHRVATARERYRGPKSSADTDCKRTEAPNSGIGNQTMHRNLSLSESRRTRHDGCRAVQRAFFRVSTIPTIPTALDQTTTRPIATGRI